MKLKNSKIPMLIYRKLTGIISDSEFQELENWINTSEKNKDIYNEATNEENIKDALQKYFQYDIDEAWTKVESNITHSVKPVRPLVSKFVKYAAAVAIPLFIATYLLFKYDIVILTKEIVQQENEFHPGTKTAILTLESGKEILLGERSKLKEEIIAKTINAIDTNYTLVYNTVIEPDEEELFHTLETPRGSEYSLVLSDGSRVWLNASSKISYPDKFTGNFRKVFVQGEAYFEVTHNIDAPFIVETNTYDITVLGTTFNLMAYADESQTATTLVEGSVKISTTEDNQEHIIKPGQQAVLENQTNQITVKKVDIYQYTAWKDGVFVFKSESLESIMRKFSRWYKCDIQFNDNFIKDSKFSGLLNKHQEMRRLLNKISETCNIEFNIAADNKIIISSK